jgi:hypothetical protein
VTFATYSRVARWRRALIKRAHGNAQLQGPDVAQCGSRQRRPAATGLRLRGEQLVLGFADDRGEVRMDRGGEQVGEGLARLRLGRPFPALAERLERLRPLGRLLEQPDALGREWCDNARLHVGRFEGPPLADPAVNLHEVEVDEEIECFLLQVAGGESGIVWGDPTLVHDQVVELDRVALEQLAVLGPVTSQHDPPALPCPPDIPRPGRRVVCT